MQIELQLGNLKLNLPLADIIASQQQTNGIQLLPIALNHVLELENLAHHHKDPFDRLLIAQAIVEGATVVSKDPEFPKYQATLLW